MLRFCKANYIKFIKYHAYYLVNFAYFLYKDNFFKKSNSKKEQKLSSKKGLKPLAPLDPPMGTLLLVHMKFIPRRSLFGLFVPTANSMLFLKFDEE